MSREQPRCKDAVSWMRGNYGRGCLAPLTGTDWRAWRALVHVWDLWVYTESERVLGAALELLHQMQHQTRDHALAVVPFAGNWTDELKLRAWFIAKGLEGINPKGLEAAAGSSADQAQRQLERDYPSNGGGA